MQYFHLTGKPFKYSKGELDFSQEGLHTLVSAQRANISLRKKLHSVMSSWGMHGYTKLQNGVPSRLYFLMNQGSMPVLETGSMGGVLKDKLSRTRCHLQRAATSVYSLQWLWMDMSHAVFILEPSMATHSMNSLKPSYCRTVRPTQVRDQLLLWTMLRFTSLRYC